MADSNDARIFSKRCHLFLSSLPSCLSRAFQLESILALGTGTVGSPSPASCRHSGVWARCPARFPEPSQGTNPAAALPVIHRGAVGRGARITGTFSCSFSFDSQNLTQVPANDRHPVDSSVFSELTCDSSFSEHASQTIQKESGGWLRAEGTQHDVGPFSNCQLILLSLPKTEPRDSLESLPAGDIWLRYIVLISSFSGKENTEKQPSAVFCVVHTVTKGIGKRRRAGVAQLKGPRERLVTGQGE